MDSQAFQAYSGFRDTQGYPGYSCVYGDAACTRTNYIILVEICQTVNKYSTRAASGPILEHVSRREWGRGGVGNAENAAADAVGAAGTFPAVESAGRVQESGDGIWAARKGKRRRQHSASSLQRSENQAGRSLQLFRTWDIIKITKGRRHEEKGAKIKGTIGTADERR